jgi:hypothetical protein
LKILLHRGNFFGLVGLVFDFCGKGKEVASPVLLESSGFEWFIFAFLLSTTKRALEELK